MGTGKSGQRQQPQQTVFADGTSHCDDDGVHASENGTCWAVPRGKQHVTHSVNKWLNWNERGQVARCDIVHSITIMSGLPQRDSAAFRQIVVRVCAYVCNCK